MRIGLAIQETWSFLREIYQELQTYHDVTLFEKRAFSLPVFNERVNRALFNRDLQTFMRRSDVVFFEWASELLAVASRLPKACGIVTRLHRYEMYQWVDQINWDNVDAIILVSQAKRREFLQRFSDQAAKVVVIPEAISLNRFPFQSRPFQENIGTLCHLKPRKRVYELVLAFYTLLQQDDRFHLHIGGGEADAFGEYYQALRVLLDRLNLHDKVTLYGHISQPEEWYRNIDLFVSHSYSEGWQVSLLEAMASGCYCLSHQWDGADELLPAENLYFTEGELVERILAYSRQDPAEQETARRALRAIVENSCDMARRQVEIRELIEAVGRR